MRTQKGSTLEAWYGAGYSTSIVLVRDAEHPRVIGSVPDGGVALAPLILLQQPSGTLLVYLTAVTGTFRLSSSDDGRTWTMPVRTALSADARIEGGAVLPDGTPIFAAIDDYQADPWTPRCTRESTWNAGRTAPFKKPMGRRSSPHAAPSTSNTTSTRSRAAPIYSDWATGTPAGPARRLPKQLIGFLTADRLGNLVVVSAPGGTHPHHELANQGDVVLGPRL
jgi:hypothetical protein